MLTLVETPPRHTALSAPGLSADRRPHAIVIGAGFGGLSAAIRLGARGYRVTVIDKLSEVGGRATAFRQAGFTFDAGPTIVTAPHLLEELWATAGRRLADDVTLKPLDPFYVMRFDDGETFRVGPGVEAMEAEIARIAPGDLAGYRKIVSAGALRYRIGFEGMGLKPFGSFAHMAPWVVELVRLRADRSVHTEVCRHIRDPRLQAALSFHPLFLGGDPFAVTSMYCLVAFLESQYGVHYTMGGTNALARAMAAVIEGQGGAIALNEEVDRITVADGRANGVALADGTEVAADVVVSNADAAWTYKHLLRDQPRKRWTDRRVDRTRYSNGLFVWYFGTNRRWDDVDHHTILMGPRYGELIKDIFRRGVLADDMSIYLHRPSASDPSVAPPGCDAFYALAPVPHTGFDIDWEAAAPRYRALMMQRLEETVLPGLGDALVTETQLTPPDFETRYRSVNGAGFSFEPTLFQSAWFRPHNRSEEVGGLYLVGAGTHPGAGLPGVVMSAKILDQLVPHAADLR